MRRARWAAGAAFALGLAAIGDAPEGAARGAPAGVTARPAAALSTAASSASAPLALPVELPAPPLPPARGVDDPRWGQDPAVVADPLEAYVITSVYPPASRPLGRFNDDLLNPNQRHEDFVDSTGGQVTFRFTADRYFVTADEVLETTLEVRRGGRPVPVVVTTAFAAPYQAGVIPPEAERLPLVFSPAGDLQVNRSTPAALAGRDATGIVGVYVEFDHGGGRERAHFVVHATPAAAVPARFTGDFRDALADGSLVVHAGLAVDAPGWYLIDCNLYDAEDRPVAWTRWKGELGAGVQHVPLVFFGKVLVDSRATPPFHLGQLRGARFVEGRDPDLDQMPSFAGTYETADFELTELSDAPYDSPEKRRRLELLTEAKRQGRFTPR